jgi:hypothetical protein
MRHKVRSTVDPITAQRGTELNARLWEAGWEISERRDTGLEWWAAEMWILASVWTPKGKAAYLTFLTDPQYETCGPRVWAIGLAEHLPHSRADAGAFGTFTVRHCWQGELASLIECLAALRIG